MNKSIGLLALCFLLTALSAQGQGLFDTATKQDEMISREIKKIELGGYARGIAFGGGKTYDFASLFGEFALKGKLSDGKAYLYGDVRFRSGTFFDQRNTTIQLKEAYAGYKSKIIDVFLGNQIIAWGRTDGFNPTNNILSHDYFFLTPEPDDQKLGNFMFRAKAHFSSQIELDLIAIPHYLPSVYRYDLFDMGPGVQFLDFLKPDAKLKNGSMAARLNVELPAAGFSLSFFNGFDPFYGYMIDTFSLVPEPDIRFRPKPYKKTSLGVDLVIPFSKFIIRGEAAYDLTRDYNENMYIPNPGLYYVAGLESSFAGYTSIWQYIGRYAFDFTELPAPAKPFPVAPGDPAYPLYLYALLQYSSNMVSYESAVYNRKIFQQQEKTNHALMLSLNKSFAYETITAELSYYYNITSKESLLRPGLKWNMSDALSVSAGATFMKGPEGSVFDRAGKVLGGFFFGLTSAF